MMEFLFFHRSIYCESIVMNNTILVVSLSKGRFNHKELKNQVIDYLVNPFGELSKEQSACENTRSSKDRKLSF